MVGPHSSARKRRKKSSLRGIDQPADDLALAWTYGESLSVSLKVSMSNVLQVVWVGFPRIGKKWLG